MLNTEDKDVADAIARGIGEEIRHRREAQGWSRAHFVTQLPSGLGDRTLLAYEHGLRQLTVVRLIELSERLGVGSPIILGQGLQRAMLALDNTPLRVDLRKLLCNTEPRIRPLHQWAKNRMTGSDNGVVEISPAGVRELEAAFGYPPGLVARHLAKFIPTTERSAT